MWLGADMNPWIVASERIGAAIPPASAAANISACFAFFFMPRIIPFFGLVCAAVAAFSSGKDEAGREADRSLWLKIANRAGLGAFLDAFDQKASEIEELERDHRRLRSPASEDTATPSDGRSTQSAEH